MDLFLIYYDLYVIYDQITFFAVTFDWNEILTCSFFVGLCGFRAITQTAQIQLIMVIHGI